jgi:hypothetical protein
MVTSALEQNSRLPSQGSDRQPAGETSFSEDHVVVQDEAREMTEPETRPKEDLLRLDRGDLRMHWFKNYNAEKNYIMSHELAKDLQPDLGQGLKREIVCGIIDEVKTGHYPVSNEFWNSVPHDQRAVDMIAKAIVEAYRWQGAIEREYVRDFIVRRREWIRIERAQRERRPAPVQTPVRTRTERMAFAVATGPRQRMTRDTSGDERSD